MDRSDYRVENRGTVAGQITQVSLYNQVFSLHYHLQSGLGDLCWTFIWTIKGEMETLALTPYKGSSEALGLWGEVQMEQGYLHIFEGTGKGGGPSPGHL